MSTKSARPPLASGGGEDRLTSWSTSSASGRGRFRCGRVREASAERPCSRMVEDANADELGDVLW